jgi:mRNA-degrading endonuclease RelE of RelBE toxin-antitoxin system
MKISASEQVQQWLISHPPKTKHKVRIALRRLTDGKGDLKALKPPLEGFIRLRIGGLRIIYRQKSRVTIQLEYANSRDQVYEVFQQVVRAMKERA